VVDRDQRASVDTSVPQAWRSATADDIQGLYSSVSIDGPAAAVLCEVHYWFEADGRFTGAALLTVPEVAYTTLSGRWHFADGSLLLSDDGLPGRAEVSGELLRLSSEEGELVFRKRALP
jgi:hypothetical protein